MQKIRGHLQSRLLFPLSFNGQFVHPVRGNGMNFVDFYWILIGWFILLSVQTFQPPIVIISRGNFVYLHWKCTLIYRPLTYPFRSLSYSCSSSINSQSLVILLGIIRDKTMDDKWMYIHTQ